MFFVSLQQLKLLLHFFQLIIEKDATVLKSVLRVATTAVYASAWVFIISHDKDKTEYAFKHFKEITHLTTVNIEL